MNEDAEDGVGVARGGESGELRAVDAVVRHADSQAPYDIVAVSHGEVVIEGDVGDVVLLIEKDALRLVAGIVEL